MRFKNGFDWLRAKVEIVTIEFESIRRLLGFGD